MNQDDRELVERACTARERAHAPYSGFRVGAALRAVDGSLHVGVNVENVSFGLSVCAERHAVAAAVAAGVRDLAALAICGDGEEPTSPCGACRQVLHEFAPDLRVIMVGAAGAAGPVEIANLADLLPGAFADFGGGPPEAP
jgi:cytidine deaminase